MINTHTYDGIEVYRQNHLLAVKFKHPHRALTTCRQNGGVRDGLQALVNHQVCEPSKDHASPSGRMAMKDPAGYHQDIAASLGMAGTDIALFSTAANMNNAGFAQECFQELEVTAIITAGVESNAGCAGDPCGYYETAEGYVRTGIGNNLGPGTIVTMLFINRELLNSALLTASTVATEAKSAVLRELNVGSNYSQKVATGTGTDQIGIACQTHNGHVYRDAGKHAKLGELIGLAVTRALRESLLLQNGLSPLGQRKLTAVLKRFGLYESKLKELVSAELQEPERSRWEHNAISVLHDPMVSAAVTAFLSGWETLQSGIYPRDHVVEILANLAAPVACAVSSHHEEYPLFRSRIANALLNRKQDLDSLLPIFLAMGFNSKWTMVPGVSLS